MSKLKMVENDSHLSLGIDPFDSSLLKYVGPFIQQWAKYALYRFI